MNISSNPEIADYVIKNDNDDYGVIDHPMKPFGMRYWKNRQYFNGFEDYVENSFQACSWLRDQEYLVDFKFYKNLELKDGSVTDFLHIFPKIRSVVHF